jgi:hypothetical protein
VALQERPVAALGIINLLTMPFVQNLRRGHYELAVDLHPNHRISVAFTELAVAI